MLIYRLGAVYKDHLGFKPGKRCDKSLLQCNMKKLNDRGDPDCIIWTVVFRKVLHHIPKLRTSDLS